MSHGLSIYSENYGCASNRYDYEVILGQLSKAGHIFEKDASKADLILVNTCAVKKPTEDKIISRLTELAGSGKPLIISGCLAKVNREKICKAIPGFSAIVDPFSIPKIALIVSKAAQGEKNRVYFSDVAPDTSDLPRLRGNRFISIVKISEGCLGDCAYCCTKFARGRLFSFHTERVVEAVKSSVKEGAREIYLTSQDTGCYGRDRKTSLLDLLKKIERLDGDFKVRVGMMTPNTAMEIIDELLDILNGEKFFKFIHIPVQSGSDRVLKDMNRRYTAENFIALCEKIRRKNSEFAICTDVIVGYPTEATDDFEKTMELIRRVRPDITNISRYNHRPGTASSRLPTPDTDTVKRRSKRLTLLCSRLSRESNARMVGRRFYTYFTDLNERGALVARSPNYKRVLVERGRSLLGMKAYVEAVGYTARYLLGRIL